MGSLGGEGVDRLLDSQSLKLIIRCVLHGVRLAVVRGVCQHCSISLSSFSIKIGQVQPNEMDRVEKLKKLSGR